MRQEDAEDLQKKIMSAKFDFNDFLKQTRAVAKMGSMTRVLGMIPGMGKVSPAQIRDAEKSLVVMEAMIEAMTPGFVLFFHFILIQNNVLFSPLVALDRGKGEARVTSRISREKEKSC